MKKKIYKTKSTMWIYPGEHANWHFLTIPKEISSEVREAYKSLRKGFGLVPVKVTIGKTTWETSVFPDTKTGTYLLPVKTKVRRLEGIYAEEKITFTFNVR